MISMRSTKSSVMIDKEHYPLYIMLERIQVHVDPRAYVRDNVLYYSIKMKPKGKWKKKSMSLEEATRIVEECYGN